MATGGRADFRCSKPAKRLSHPKRTYRHSGFEQLLNQGADHDAPAGGGDPPPARDARPSAGPSAGRLRVEADDRVRLRAVRPACHLEDQLRRDKTSQAGLVAQGHQIRARAGQVEHAGGNPVARDGNQPPSGVGQPHAAAMPVEDQPAKDALDLGINRRSPYRRPRITPLGAPGSGPRRRSPQVAQPDRASEVRVLMLGS